MYITIAAWVKTGSDVTSTQYILAKWNEAANQRSYAVSIESSTVYFLTSETGTLATVNSFGSGSVSANTWYHIAVASDGVNKKIFINGTQAGSDWPWAKTINAGSAPLILGSRYELIPVDLFDGIIDEVSIYNTLLTDDEIKALSRRSKYSSDVGIPAVGAEELVP